MTLAALQALPLYTGQVVHVADMSAREPLHAEPEIPLPDPLRSTLKTLGIDRLFGHQVRCNNTTKMEVPAPVHHCAHMLMQPRAPRAPARRRRAPPRQHCRLRRLMPRGVDSTLC